MGNKQTCAQTRDQLENPKRIKTEQSSSRSLLQHTETKRKLHQHSCNPRRIHENFQLHRKALVGLLQISLSPHTANKGALQFPHTRHSLFSLSLFSLSPSLLPLMVASSDQSGAGIRNGTPNPSGYQFWVSIPENKLPGFIYTHGGSNDQIPGYCTAPWLSKTQIPGLTYRRNLLVISSGYV